MSLTISNTHLLSTGSLTIDGEIRISNSSVSVNGCTNLSSDSTILLGSAIVEKLQSQPNVPIVLIDGHCINNHGVNVAVTSGADTNGCHDEHLNLEASRGLSVTLQFVDLCSMLFQFSEMFEN